MDAYESANAMLGVEWAGSRHAAAEGVTSRSGFRPAQDHVQDIDMPPLAAVSFTAIPMQYPKPYKAT